MLTGSSFVSAGYTKIKESKSIPLFITKKIKIYLFSKQTIIQYHLEHYTKKVVMIKTSYTLFSIEKIKED